MGSFFPEWMPLWFQLIVVGVVVIFGLCFLLMPFSVLGLKSRLTYLDHQMEDIQSQLRVLLKRLPDARERLEFKLQPIPTGDDEVGRSGVVNKGKKLKDSSAEYYAAVASTKNRPTCFDPPSQSEEVDFTRSPEKETHISEEEQNARQNRFRERGPAVSRQEQQFVNPGRREDQIYNPPSKPVKEERQEGSQPRRRAEPILRWPPR
ncbi:MULTISPECIES: hypothetical protein [Commensalibacter]|uniref:Uncharacterized protein n=2 Tax=Commensalibacter TaxID=1079922 RepID=W7DLI7_9PROT|nr:MULTISPECIES: hypothetical protein [Commensalibacter]EUK18112.1 hypothetical protein COMX_00140 [Commensalibacter papalotli (ex Servin-Garciduenas et al. 2014)]CAI3936371.1 unnamed protein product [Commensalibacter papalotli (ex Botero et al. 2024)]CAI3939291.1 unnamed protein product [Commensalibacter papalotli (ex Botero et al. 2024)]